MASPLIEAFLRRAQYGVGRINTKGAAIGSALQPFAGNVQSYYGPIQSQESALGGALNQSQTSTGQQLGSQIGGALQGIQAPGAAVSQYGGGTATTGQQAGAAVGALSSADLERLRSQASAEQIYASALPRLAALAADQERRGFLEDAQQELADLAAQEAENAYARAQDQREWQRQAKQDRIERSRYRTSQRQRKRDTAYERKHQAKLDALAQQAASYEMGQDYISNSQAQQRIQQGQQRINLAVRRQNESERQFQAREARMQRQFQVRINAAKKAGGKPNSALSAKYGYIVDSNGRPILGKNGKKIPVSSDSSAAPWAK